MSQKSVPLYQQKRKQVAGVEAALGAGDKADGPGATWLIRAASLAGVVPQPGDRCRGTDGVWWTVKAVGPLADGAYPCLCDRDGEGE